MYLLSVKSINPNIKVRLLANSGTIKKLKLTLKLKFSLPFIFCEDNCLFSHHALMEGQTCKFGRVCDGAVCYV